VWNGQSLLAETRKFALRLPFYLHVALSSIYYWVAIVMFQICSLTVGVSELKLCGIMYSPDSLHRTVYSYKFVGSTKYDPSNAGYPS
jgi:hypothetical protein